MKDEDRTKEQPIRDTAEMREHMKQCMDNGSEVGKAIARAKLELERAFDQIPDLIAVMDTGCRIIRLNMPMANRLGLAPRDAVGATCYELIHGRKEPLPSCPHSRWLANGRGAVEELKEGRLDGVYLTSVSPFYDAKGRLGGCVLVARDITSRKKAEDALRESEERLRTVLDTVKEGIIFSDEVGHFEVFNSGMERLTGYTMAEANACTDFNMLLYPGLEARTRALSGLEGLKDIGDSIETETVIRTKSGARRNLLVSTTLVSHKDRKMYLSACHDITERRKAEEEKERLIAELQEAVSSIKTLKGLIPICAWCKRIRDDKGYWTQIEEYLKEHSGADFTHGICDECLERLNAEA